MMTRERMSAVVSPSAQDDAALVCDALAGNRRAFGEIVGRYQTLICSMAYSATGNLSHSEDLAQDTFVTAWKQLPQLREREKLRAWLCGIARFVIGKATRRNEREPSHAAESLDGLPERAAAEALPRERAMTREEEAILWRAIERIPETYREPLVLFYREHQSIGAVAAALELSEDAVKQRLSRGRKLLQEEVLGFVEGALARTAPGAGFTIAVLAALPALVFPAQAAAALGSAGAIGSAGANGTIKAAAGSGLFGTFVAPVLALFGTWVGYRLDLDSANSEMERDFTKQFYRRLAGALLAFFLGMTLAGLVGQWTGNASGFLGGAVAAMGLAYVAFVTWLLVWMQGQRRKAVAQLTAERGMAGAKPAWEFRSGAAFLGLPLVHARVGGGLLAQKDPVKAWIAIGDIACGGLFAFGGVAIAPISVGGCALGILPFGGVAAGVMALGGIAAGGWAFGGLALGWQAFGAIAIAWQAGAGGMAIAHDFALGGTARAIHANDGPARAFIQEQGFFRAAVHIFQYHLAWMNIVWVLPMIAWWRMVRRAKQRALA
jgi:RNA polymerase sigma factor (sigma-70 family)